MGVGGHLLHRQNIKRRVSEAINSMFLWYSKSATCYAYLEDVHSIEGVKTRIMDDRDGQIWRPPRWFTRGWTLQELIAPLHLVFYSAGWEQLGLRSQHHELISKLTGIDSGILAGTVNLDEVPVATRMSWASKRKTTRKEDEAYCLLGIFDVNMPLLYGEREKAFQRLLEQILKKTEDQTVFLCGPTWIWDSLDCQPYHGRVAMTREFLAGSPQDFDSCSKFRPVFAKTDPNARLSTMERGVGVNARLANITSCESLRRISKSLIGLPIERGDLWLMGLNCSVVMDQLSSIDRRAIIGEPENMRVAVLVGQVFTTGKSDSVFTRLGNWCILVPHEEMEAWEISSCYIKNPGISIEVNSMPLSWMTATFGYREHYRVERISFLDNTSSNLFSFTWAAVLDDCAFLPWLLVTFCVSDSEDMVACDIWRVPDTVQAKLVSLSQERKLVKRHQADVLCASRAWLMDKSEIGYVLTARYRDHGLLTRASCLVTERMEATLTVMGNFDMYMSIRAPLARVGQSAIVERPKISPEEVCAYIDRVTMPALHQEFFEEYESDGYEEHIGEE